jgi:hypothetical protein
MICDTRRIESRHIGSWRTNATRPEVSVEQSEPAGEPKRTSVRKDPPLAEYGLTVAEVASRITMPPNTIKRWAYRGWFPASVGSDGTLRFRPEDLDTAAVRSTDPDGEAQPE